MIDVSIEVGVFFEKEEFWRDKISDEIFAEDDIFSSVANKEVIKKNKDYEEYYYYWPKILRKCLVEKGDKVKYYWEYIYHTWGDNHKKPYVIYGKNSTGYEFKRDKNGNMKKKKIEIKGEFKFKREG